MGLLNKIFGRNSKQREHLPSLWEDDYCQIEIAPRKNIQHIQFTIKQIEEFTEKVRTDYGFTDIFARKDLPFTTLNEELRVDSFEKFLNKKGFKKAQKIYYQGHKVIECSKSTSNAFSLSSFHIFYDGHEEFIKNIWVSISYHTSISHSDKIIETLYELGEGYELVLVDWNTSDLIDLTDKKQIKNYLRSFSN